MSLDRDFHKLVPYSPRVECSLYEGGWKPFWEVYGEDLFVDLVVAVRNREEVREEIITDLRHAWWTIRNQGARTLKTDSGRDAIRQALETYELMWFAGYTKFDLHRLSDCLSHRCACEGCDLMDGRRFKCMPEDWEGKPEVMRNGPSDAMQGVTQQSVKTSS